MSVKLIARLVETNGKNLRFVSEDSNNTRFKLSALHRLYVGKSPVNGAEFYVRDAPVELIKNGKMCMPSEFVGDRVEVTVGVRKYKSKKDGAVVVGWALDLQQMCLI